MDQAARILTKARAETLQRDLPYGALQEGSWDALDTILYSELWPRNAS